MKSSVGKRLTENGRLYQGDRFLGIVSYDLRVLECRDPAPADNDPPQTTVPIIVEGSIDVDAEEALLDIELRLELADGTWCTLVLKDTSGKVQGRFL